MKTLSLTLIALLGLGFAACATVKGAGTDLQRASDAVEKKL